MANHGKSTNQVIFDRVCKHLRKQQCRSTSNTGGCMYRGAGGLKCAVGALISDKYYSPDLEGVVTDAVVSAVRKSMRLPLHHDSAELLQELQYHAHDVAAIRGVWSPSLSEEGLKTVAAQFNLVYTPPKQKKGN